MLPLEGIRIVDMTQNVAGPYASMILAELGAQVTKVEPPSGDSTRGWGPPFWEGESPTYLALNRNKSRVVLDLKTEAGMREIRDMIREADVFMHSSRPGAIERLGLDYESVKAIQPRIIYAEVTAFGTDGPKRMHPGYDPLMQALGGIMSVTGHPGQPPVRVGVSINDMGTGLWVAIGIQSALRLREKTGRGHKVTGALYETAIAWMSYHILSYWASGQPPGKWGSGTAMIVPYSAFQAKDDKWLIIAAGNDHLFEKLSRALGHEEWARDERFVTNAGRLVHREELERMISDAVRLHDSDHWIRLLEAEGIPVASIQDVEELTRDPQFLASGMVQTLEHPRIKGFKSIGIPIKIDDERPPLRMMP